MRGWLAAIHRRRDPHGQIVYYRNFQNLFSTFSNWSILPWDTAAADTFDLALFVARSASTNQIRKHAPRAPGV
jgi:hypothetical protein